MQHTPDPERAAIPRPKMVYLSPQGHRRLKLLAARRNVPMGKLMEELIDRELEDLANPWTSPEGLLLQQAVLADGWKDPALDVYGHD